MQMDVDDLKERIRDIVKEEMGIVPRVKIIAFGGAAGKMAQYIASKKITGAKVIAVNADARVSKLAVDKKLVIGKETLGEHEDTNGETRVAEYIIDTSKTWIMDEVRDADAVVLMAALGGGMGTGGLIETLRFLKKSSKPMLSILLLPFSAERSRRKVAIDALKTIDNEKLGIYFTIDSDSLLTDKSMKLSDGYQKLYNKAYNLVNKLTDITRNSIEQKFKELFIEDLPEIVEQKIKMYSNTIVA